MLFGVKSMEFLILRGNTDTISHRMVLILDRFSILPYNFLEKNVFLLR